MRGRRARTLHRSFPVRLSDCCNNRLQIDPSQAISFPLSEFNNTTPRSWLTNTYVCSRYTPSPLEIENIHPPPTWLPRLPPATHDDDDDIGDMERIQNKKSLTDLCSG
ncbi:hypothetical protein QL093DRAFT_1025162 [Fusarium oxysporum]|nr:hypothetical protein QL093DRAFT_1025162 [Fusarium oxysporum]